MSEDALDIAREKTRAAIAFACGLVFAIGLGLAGMTSPAKILAFLDVTSPSWDPSLAFVMAGAIGTHLLFARRAARHAREGRAPRLAARFFLPEKLSIDRSLLLGSALFGAGWGLAGYCPGPALVAFIVTPVAVVSVGAMLAGMWGTRVVRERIEARAANHELVREMEGLLSEANAQPSTKAHEMRAEKQERRSKRPAASR